MSFFTQQLRNNYKEYLIHLGNGGKRFSFEEKRVHIPGLVHASNLADCPLKAASEYSGKEPVFPKFTKEANLSQLTRMQIGVRVAESFQESFLYGADHYTFYDAFCELSVHDELIGVQGRIDGFVYSNNDYLSHVIEIKNRLPQWKSPMAQPRFGDVLQMLAYKEITKADQAHLVILNVPSFKDYMNDDMALEIWSLEEEGEGYILTSEHGYGWQDHNNSSIIINVRVLKEEIARQLRYLNGETTSPIDLLDREHSWACASVKLYPKNGNPGVMMPICPFWCHTAPEQAENGIQYTDEGVVYDF